MQVCLKIKKNALAIDKKKTKDKIKKKLSYKRIKKITIISQKNI